MMSLDRDTHAGEDMAIPIVGTCPGCSSGEPDTVAWELLHFAHHEARDDVDSLRDCMAEATLGLASFENLFRISPIPVIEQDYTRLEEWMGTLRRSGVTDIREYLGDDIEAVRSVIPLIWIVTANPAAVKAVGLPLEDLIGPIDPRIANEDALPSWLSQLEAVWNGQPEASAAFLAATPDGRTYDAESTLAAPIVNGEPDFSRAVFTLVDVTPHRNEERRMEDLLEAKNRFLTAVSHEIRTPLTAILGFSELLNDDEGLGEDDRQFMLTSLVEQAQEASDLVEDLLVAARAQAGQVNVESVVFDVVEQVRRTLAAGGSYASAVRVESPPGSVFAVGDPARVRQVLRNLLTNAERYGGPHVSLAVGSDEEWVHVDVTDDGPGLAPDEWERIFDLYHRVGHARGRPESVGIGLTVSRQLADLMGGTLRYVGHADRSVFRLSLRRSESV